MSHTVLNDILKTITAEYNSFCDESTGVESTGDEPTGHRNIVVITWATMCLLALAC